jgi:predicted phosphodiesterase
MAKSGNWSDRILERLKERGPMTLSKLVRTLHGSSTSELDGVVRDLESAGKLRVFRHGRTVFLSLTEEGLPVLDGRPVRETKTQSPYPRSVARPTTFMDPIGPVLIPGDLHFPVHDEAAVAAMVAFAREFGIKHVVLCGDAVDFCCLSEHRQEAERVLGGEWTVWAEVASIRPLLDELLEFVARIDWIPGNHEYRLKRFADANKQWHDHPSLSLSEVLRPPPGVVLHPWRSRLVVGDVVFEHGDQLQQTLGKYGADAVLRNTSNRITIYGHTHRLQCARKRVHGADGSYTRIAQSVGHLSDLRKQTWVGDPDWQQGFAVVEFFDGGDKIHAVEVDCGCFVFGGKVYGD